MDGSHILALSILGLVNDPTRVFDAPCVGDDSMFEGISLLLHSVPPIVLLAILSLRVFSRYTILSAADHS